MAQKPLFPKNLTREELNSLVDKAADISRTAKKQNTAGVK